jgi:hypothetical protein
MNLKSKAKFIQVWNKYGNDKENNTNYNDRESYFSVQILLLLPEIKYNLGS